MNSYGDVVPPCLYRPFTFSGRGTRRGGCWRMQCLRYSLARWGKRKAIRVILSLSRMTPSVGPTRAGLCIGGSGRQLMPIGCVCVNLWPPQALRPLLLAVFKGCEDPPSSRCRKSVFMWTCRYLRHYNLSKCLAEAAEISQVHGARRLCLYESVAFSKTI